MLDDNTKTKIKAYLDTILIVKPYEEMDMVDAQAIYHIFLEENLHDFIGDAIAFAADKNADLFKSIANFASGLNYMGVGVEICVAIDNYLERIDFIEQVNELIREYLAAR